MKQLKKNWEKQKIIINRDNLEATVKKKKIKNEIQLSLEWLRTEDPNNVIQQKAAQRNVYVSNKVRHEIQNFLKYKSIQVERGVINEGNLFEILCQ